MFILGNKPRFFVLDVESVGLYGEGFSVGFVVINKSDGKELDSGYYRCNPALAKGRQVDWEWAMANTVPVMEQHVYRKHANDCTAPHVVRCQLSAMLTMWYSECDVAADVPFPVEANFLAQCFDENVIPESVYPLIDIASVMAAAGMDPMKDYDRLENELPKHHPLADARQSARLLFEAIGRLK